MTILLVYASKHGHTAKIAERIAETLEHDGVEVTQARLGDGVPPSPHGFDAVVVGASIHASKHQDAVVRWGERHRDAPRPGPLRVLQRLPDGRRRHGGVAHRDPRLPRRLRRAQRLDAHADDDVRRRAAVPRVRLRDAAADAPADAARRPSDRRVARLRLHGLGRGRALRARVRGAPPARSRPATRGSARGGGRRPSAPATTGTPTTPRERDGAPGRRSRNVGSAPVRSRPRSAGRYGFTTTSAPAAAAIPRRRRRPAAWRGRPA